MSGGGAKTQSSGPPKWLQNQFIKPALNDARGLYQNSTFFPGQTYAGFSPEQEQSMSMITDRANAGSSGLRAAQGQNEATLRGDYLYGGDGFNAAYQAAANRIMPQVQSAFGGSGRLNSGLAQTSMASALGDSFAGLFGQERARQMQATQMAPGLAQADYYDAGMLQNVGAQRQGMQQAGIDEAMARHDFPQANLERYMGLLQGAGGMAGTTQTQPMYRNRAAGALGGAMMGAQLGSVVPGIGTGVGALGGAVMGGLF